MKVMTLAVTAALCASSLFAVDADQLKGLPRGVQNIKYQDGVISTLVVVGKAAVLAEGEAAERDDIYYLEKLPVFPK